MPTDVVLSRKHRILEAWIETRVCGDMHSTVQSYQHQVVFVRLQKSQWNDRKKKKNTDDHLGEFQETKTESERRGKTGRSRYISHFSSTFRLGCYSLSVLILLTCVSSIRYHTVEQEPNTNCLFAEKVLMFSRLTMRQPAKVVSMSGSPMTRSGVTLSMVMTAVLSTDHDAAAADDDEGSSSDESSLPLAKKTAFMSTTTSGIDIGTLGIDVLQKADDETKMKILNSWFQPTKSWKAPCHLSGKKKCHVPNPFFDVKKCPTLWYSVSQDGVYSTVSPVSCSPMRIVVLLFENSPCRTGAMPKKWWKSTWKHRHTLAHRHGLQSLFVCTMRNSQLWWHALTTHMLGRFAVTRKCWLPL